MDIRNIMLPILLGVVLGVVTTPANLNEISNLETADLPGIVMSNSLKTEK